MTDKDEVVSADILIELSRFETAMLSDALDEAGLPGVISGLYAQRGDQGRIVGRALTVRFERVARDPDAYRFGGGVGRPLEQVLRRMRRGDVIVMDLGGTTTAAAWGSLASRLAQQAGVRGTLIFGACRDVEDIREIGYPVWATGTCPRRSRNEFTFGSVGDEITIGGMPIVTGDVIVADQTGVVRIPPGRLGEILAVARGIAKQEAELLAQIVAQESVNWDRV